MWDLIVSVPDHCLSFYLNYLSATVGCGGQGCAWRKARLAMVLPSGTAEGHL